MKKKMDFGKELVASLTELRDATVAGNWDRLTVRQIAALDPPRPFRAKEVQKIRNGLNLSQAVFAKLVAVSPVLVRAWEQGQRKPSPLACRLLEEIAARPDYWRDKVRA